MKYKDDPYQIEYAAIENVEILREGTWNWREYDREFMDEMALLYDPTMLRAKVIKDHDYRGPAFGHVLALRVEDDPSAEGVYRLMATTGFLEEGKAMVESGEYNERSQGWASFYPTPGFPYLWEFSLLGANTPAVYGMGPIVFTEEDEDTMMQQLAIDHVNEGLTSEAIANKLTWEKDDEYIQHKVRNKSRFRTALRTVELDVEAGVLAKVGKLKAKYVGDDGDPNSLVMQSVMFVLDKGWTLAKAMAWVGSRQLSAMAFTLSNVIPFQDLDLADGDEEGRDNVAAEVRRRKWAGGEDDMDWDKYRMGFLWYDSDEKETFGAYKFPVADIVDGNLKIVPRAVFAAASAIGDARGDVDIPDDDIDGVKSHLEKYYDKMDRKAPWQEDTNADSQQGIKTKTDLTTLDEGGKATMADTKTDVKDTDVEKVTPDVADVQHQIVVEKGTTADLSKRNVELLEEKDRCEQEAQTRLLKENEELATKATEARTAAIESEVRALHAGGYITAQQVELGLAKALATMPDGVEILVDGRKRNPREIIVDALKYGGKLKLKLEIAKDLRANDATDTLARARAAGIDTSTEERRIQLMKDNPDMSHADALDRAIAESQEVKK